MFMLCIACNCLRVLFGVQSKLLIECYSVTLTFDRVATQSFVQVRSCYYNLLIVNLNIFLYTYKICRPWPLTIRMSQLGGMALGRDG